MQSLTFSFAVTAITTNVSAQNMTEGNMTGGNMTEGNMTGAGQISGEIGGPEGTNSQGGCIADVKIESQHDLY